MVPFDTTYTEFSHVHTVNATPSITHSMVSLTRSPPSSNAVTQPPPCPLKSIVHSHTSYTELAHVHTANAPPSITQPMLSSHTPSTEFAHGHTFNAMPPQESQWSPLTRPTPNMHTVTTPTPCLLKRVNGPLSHELHRVCTRLHSQCHTLLHTANGNLSRDLHGVCTQSRSQRNALLTQSMVPSHTT